MPQLDILTYTSQLFWFLICFGIFYFAIAKFFIPKITFYKSKREQIINKDKSDLASLIDEAEDLENSYQAKLKKAKKDAISIVNNANMQTKEYMEFQLSQLNQRLNKEIAEKSSKLKEQLFLSEETLRDICSYSVKIMAENLGYNFSNQEIEDTLGSKLKKDVFSHILDKVKY